MILLSVLDTIYEHNFVGKYLLLRYSKRLEKSKFELNILVLKSALATENEIGKQVHCSA